jgi:hypothetical protein
VVGVLTPEVETLLPGRYLTYVYIKSIKNLKIFQSHPSDVYYAVYKWVLDQYK